MIIPLVVHNPGDRNPRFVDYPMYTWVVPLRKRTYMLEDYLIISSFQ